MTRLDEREKRVALWAAAFGAVSAVALYAPGFDEFAAALVLALVGVVMAGLLALASRSGSRLFTCLAAGLLGIGPWGFAYIIGLPFVLLAGWLVYRDANARRAARGPRVRQRPTDEPPVNEKRGEGEQGRERPVKQGPVKRGKERRPAKEAPPKPSTPGASKRYTPPAGRR